ncbi:MAG TPA: PrsW family glutamic-type intramembrane protease [Candidatus Paceibacterota bacterium]|nr:PrsW family glutamic-type intramembrane protease [Candidatus Paceibacterota bacterium]
MTSVSVVYAFLAGIVPALVWLVFLLREDAKNPEPKRLIALAFLAGMAAVILALLLEHMACESLGGCTATPRPPVILAWAVVEEVLKYLVVAGAILWRKDVDEPLDYVVYMLTAALGFAALENALFLMAPFAAGQYTQGILTDDLRFVGSTLLHIIASSIIGFALAFSVRFEALLRTVIAGTGLILAVALHALFNLLIISQGGSSALPAFFTVWTGIIVLFALFEVLKRYENRPL